MEYADSVLSAAIVTAATLGFMAWFLLQVVNEAEQRRKEMENCDIW